MTLKFEKRTWFTKKSSSNILKVPGRQTCGHNTHLKELKSTSDWCPYLQVLYAWLQLDSFSIKKNTIKIVVHGRGGSKDFKKEGGVALYVGHHGCPTKKILGFRWPKKAKRTLETKVFGETFLSVFSNFLHFNESLPMKSYQFFKIYIRFYKKRE